MSNCVRTRLRCFWQTKAGKSPLNRMELGANGSDEL